MSEKKFHLPARKKKHTDKSEVARITKDAYNAAVDMFNDSQCSLSQVISKAILFASENAVYDKED